MARLDSTGQAAITYTMATANSSLAFASASFAQAYTMINALVGIAQQAAGINVSLAAHVVPLTVPSNSPNIDLLQFGASGISEEAEAAIYNRGLERARQLLKDSLDAARSRWAERGFPLADGVLVAAISAEIDRYEDGRRDASRDTTIKSYDMAVDFARVTIELMTQWATESLRIQMGSATDVENLRLKQAEMAISQFVERTKLQMQALRGSADAVSELAAAALAGIHAGASLTAGYSDSAADNISSSVASSISTSRSEVTSTYQSSEQSSSEIITMQSGQTTTTSSATSSQSGGSSNESSESTSNDDRITTGESIDE